MYLFICTEKNPMSFCAILVKKQITSDLIVAKHQRNLRDIHKILLLFLEKCQGLEV